MTLAKIIVLTEEIAKFHQNYICQKKFMIYYIYIFIALLACKSEVNPLSNDIH